MTVASLGDSRAALDTGAGVVQLSVDHRVATHKGERRRLDALGVQIAPIDTSGARRRGLCYWAKVEGSGWMRCACRSSR